MSALKHMIFITYLAALAALAPFSTDAYLASMPVIQKLFATTAARVQLTLSLFFICYALAQLFWGPLSDRIGRKPVLYIGLPAYILGSLMSGLSHSIDMLIVARVTQGFGACSGIVIAIAIVKDTFTDPKEMSRILSGMMSVLIIAPMIAPVVGTALLVHFGWRSTFYFLATLGGLLLVGLLGLSESYPKQARKPLPLNRLCHAYNEQIRHWPFFLATLAIATNFSIMFAFISSSSFVYIKIYHLPQHLFGYFFALNASSLLLGTITLRVLKRYLSDKAIVFGSASLSFVSAAVMLCALYLLPGQIWALVVPCYFVTYGVGILFPELTQQALMHVLDYTGLASSLIGSVRFVLAAGVAFLMGLIVHDNPLPLPLMMLLLSGATIVSMCYYYRCNPSRKQEKP